MSSSPPPPAPVRPSASVRRSDVVNADIRALWLDPRVRLSAEGRRRYELLYEEWAAAVRAEVVEAA